MNINNSSVYPNIWHQLLWKLQKGTEWRRSVCVRVCVCACACVGVCVCSDRDTIKHLLVPQTQITVQCLQGLSCCRCSEWWRNMNVFTVVCWQRRHRGCDSAQQMACSCTVRSHWFIGISMRAHTSPMHLFYLCCLDTLFVFQLCAWVAVLLVPLEAKQTQNSLSLCVDCVCKAATEQLLKGQYQSTFDMSPLADIAPIIYKYCVKMGPCVYFNRCQTPFLKPILCHSCWNRV